MKWLTGLFGYGTVTTDQEEGVPLPPREKGVFLKWRVAKEKRATVVVVVPRRLDDAARGAESLIAGSAVVLNLQHIDGSKGQRILDVMAGVAFACRGSIYEIGKRLFLFLPYDMAGPGDETAVRAITRLFAGLGDVAEGSHEVPVKV
ncbi:MAG: cell division protein SepF [Armatimonadetes bacterium]|nr:cell division protein SepF [Armatimonadota bacterium]MDW8121217.1 cell division protein SepF [Armatimonadota bacterium]